MENEKKYCAFLSFASPDKELAESINYLFADFDEQICYSDLSLSKAGEPDWRNQIIESIQQSNAFITLYTNNSIKNPWVLYELGLAEASSITRYPVIVDGISKNDIRLPGKDVLFYELYKPEKLKDLIRNILKIKYPSKDEAHLENRIKRILELSPYTKKILTIASKRKIFFAGNQPSQHTGIEKDSKYSSNDKYDISKEICWCSDEKEYQKKIVNFVDRLTISLLERNLNITSCPQVDLVGKVIAKSATTWLTKNKKPIDKYQIGGIHPINRFLGNLGEIDDNLQKQWLAHWFKFRKNYLKNHEWLIIIGGNEGTKEEYHAASDLGINIYAIPCFGGISKKIWDDIPDNYKGPCKRCKKQDGNCDSKEIEKIATFISEYYKD